MTGPLILAAIGVSLLSVPLLVADARTRSDRGLIAIGFFLAGLVAALCVWVAWDLAVERTCEVVAGDTREAMWDADRGTCLVRDPAEWRTYP